MSAKIVEIRCMLRNNFPSSYIFDFEIRGLYKKLFDQWEYKKYLLKILSCAKISCEITREKLVFLRAVGASAGFDILIYCLITNSESLFASK